jgi:hypothetical protein
MALWIGEVHAAAHGKGTAHAGSTGQTAPRNAGGPPPSAPATARAHNIGGSANNGSASSSSPPAVFRNNTQQTAPSLNLVPQGGLSRTPAAVPFSNAVPAPVHAGNVAPKLNVAAPANAAQVPSQNSISKTGSLPGSMNFTNSAKPSHAAQDQFPTNVVSPTKTLNIYTPRKLTENVRLPEQKHVPQPAAAKGRGDVPQQSVVKGPVDTAKSADAKRHVEIPQRSKMPVVTEAPKTNSNPGTAPLEKAKIRHAGVDRVEKVKLPATEKTAHDRHDGNEAVRNHGPKDHSPLGGKTGIAAARVPERHHAPTTTERLKAGKLDHLVNTQIARQVDLKKQFQLHEHGDLARRMKLSDGLARHGGWQHRLVGHVSPLYSKHAFGHYYCGPGFYPHHCWFPHWSPWVNWCWNFVCGPIYDPRPTFCQPIVYAPCSVWTVWNYPVWTGLPEVSCGTWVDVPMVVVPSGIDVQLLAVRFVDPGHPEQKMGPRYRVWFRNNTALPIEQPFDLVVYGSNEQLPGMGLPETGLRVTGMEAGQIQAVDLRLPYEANLLGRDPQGNRIPFRFLHLIVDAQRELPDVNLANNGAVLDRDEILPIDPSIFSVALDSAGGGIVDVAGEGFGPEAGQAVLELNGQELPLEILGWCDVGVQVRLPGLVLNQPKNAEIIIIRGDKAASNPHVVRIPPEGRAEIVPNPVP